MNRWINILKIAICFLIMVSNAEAEDENRATTTLETLTVTAERFPVQEKESSRFITVITSEELKESGAVNVVDALKRSGGFAYKAYGPLGTSHGGMNSTLSIRGVKDGELILINGVPIQGSAGHAYDLNTIPVEQIERIEVLKGAASTIYGANAMSGVINIITKKTKKKSVKSDDSSVVDDTDKAKSVKISTEAGSESYQNHTISASCPGVNIGANYQHLGEQEEISRSYTNKYRYATDPTERYSLNLNANMFDNLYFDYLASFNKTGFRKIFDDPKKAYEGTDQDQLKHFADVRYETADFRTKIFGNYDIMRRSQYTAKTPDDDNRNFNAGIEGDYKFNISDWRFTTGASLIHRGVDYSNQYQEHHRNDAALFMEIKNTFGERLTATAGFREQVIYGETGTPDYDRFLPSLGLTYKINEQLNIFANTGKAFRAPTFNNLYYESSFMVGNPDLKPEEGWTYETGAKYDTDILRVRFALFHMAYSEKIEIDRRGYPQTYFNAGDYASTGVEWEFGISPFTNQSGWQQDILLYTAGYWADPTAEDTSGVEYQSGPKLQNSVGFSYLTEPLVLDLNCQILTSRERNLDSYAALNFYGKVKAWRGYVTFGVDNIFDEDVQVTGDLSEGASNLYVYEDLGRLFKVGYEIAF
ncbi:MAG: TonB-dependent receptor [Desulfamplus sp.]|nr:TonB-dependent receptor [Desulfamplus sp.]